MQRTVTWIVENQLLFTSIIGALKVEHFPELDEQILDMLDKSTAPQVHILADISMMTTMPGLLQMAKLKYIAHPKVGFYVTQSRNPTEEFIGKNIGHIINSKYKFVTDLYQGCVFLTEVDRNLHSPDMLYHRVQGIRDEFIATSNEEISDR